MAGQGGGLFGDQVDDAKASPYAAGNTQSATGGGASGQGGGGMLPPTVGSNVASGASGGGLNSASGGNWIEGVGNFLGFGKPTTIGHYEGPQADKNDFYLGGSQQASEGLFGDSQARADAYGNRGVGFNASGVRNSLRAANAIRGDESALTQMLQDRAAGRGPSVAADTYQRGAQDATRRAQSLATSSRGGSGLLGATKAAELGFEGAQDAALQGGMIRKQEMNEAAGQLGQQLAARNAAELGRGGLGLDLARTGTELGQRQMTINDAAQQGELGRYLQMLQMQQGGLQNFNQMQGGWGVDMARINAGLDQTNLGQSNAQDAKRGGFIKNVAGIVGGPVGSVLGGLF